MKKFLFQLLLLLMFSCQLQEVDTPEGVTPISSYQWVKSPISPTTTIYFSLFDQDEKGNFYGFGYQGSNKVFYKLEGDTWKIIHEIKPDGTISNLESFTVYNDVVYYSSFNKIYRIENGSLKEIFGSPNGMIFYIKGFKGKMLIAGENLELHGDSYTLISFDGTQFQPISKHGLLSRGESLGNKIIFEGFPGLTYDGENVLLNDIYGYIAGADDMNNIYVIDTEVNTHKVWQKRNNNTIQLGQQITFSDNQDYLFRLDYTENTYVVIGRNNLTHRNITFVLNKNTWEKVEMTEPINFTSFLKFGGQLIGNTQNGELLELIKK